MALPKIDIALSNGNLGQVTPIQTSVGLVLQGVSEGILNKPFSITALREVEALGILPSYDAANGVRCHKHISDFYSVAPVSTRLWVVIIPQTVTMAQMPSNVAVNTMLSMAKGTISVLAFTRSPVALYVPVVNGMNSEVMLGVAAAHALTVSEASNYRPLRCVIESRDVDYLNLLSNLPDLTTYNYNGVSVLAGDNLPNSKGAAVGLLLGRIAAIPVQRNIGRVLDGAITQAAYFDAENTPLTKASVSAVFHDKGYITFRYHVGRGGYYFTDDPTATLKTDDYNAIALCRTIDKVRRIVYDSYLNYLLDEIEVDTTGMIRADIAKSWQAAAERSINELMTVNGEISGVTAFVDANQNILATKKIQIKVKVLPVGYAKNIEILLGFDNPLN
jgi:Protein of unknown function (DUF2586)